MMERPRPAERLGTTSRSRLRAVILGAAVLVLAFGAVAYGASSSLKLTGPHSNRLQTDFRYSISGFAAGAADYVVAWEQLYPRGGCATTYAAESTRAFLPATYAISLETATAVAHNRPFSLPARFHAVNRGEHGICAYVISVNTGDTYAHASAWWTNH